MLALNLGTVASLHADTVEQRLERRDFPSVFQAWSPVENIAGASELDGAARHDLYWATLEAYGLRWEGSSPGRATSFTADSIANARQRRADLLERNPDMVLLTQLRYWVGTPGIFLPADDEWWLREDGDLVPIYPEFDSAVLDLKNPEFRAHIVQRARAIMDTGVFDGVMLDSWNEQADSDERAQILQGVRGAIGEGLIVVNSNAAKPTLSAPYINGLFMETGDSADASSWSNYRDIMEWARTNLRQPAFTAFETFRVLANPDDQNRGNEPDLQRMRATTTLSLVASDGFALFGDPNVLPLSDHLHDWYPFWDVSLGRPTGPAIDLVGGGVRRNYTGGIAVHNPPGSSTTRIEFEVPVQSVTTGQVLSSHSLSAFDGDIFLFTDSSTAGEASIRDLVPPLSVNTGASVTVSVPYSTENAAELVVSFQDTSNDWATEGFQRIAIPAGTAAIDVTIDVAGDAQPGTDYAWTAWIAAPGDDWSDRLDSRTVSGVTLVSTQP